MNIVDGVYFFVRDICTAPLPHYQHFLQSRGNNSNSTSRSNNSNSRSSSTISNNSSRLSKSNNSRSRIRGRQLAHNLNNVRHTVSVFPSRHAQHSHDDAKVASYVWAKHFPFHFTSKAGQVRPALLLWASARGNFTVIGALCVAAIAQR